MATTPNPILSFDVCTTDCSNLTFTETTGYYDANINTGYYDANINTGYYDANINTGGWGSPNLDVTDAISATVIIINPSGVSNTLIIGSGFPTQYDNPFTINHSALGLSSLEDGLYQITYQVNTTTNGLITVSKNIVIYCNLECCVSKMLLDIDFSCDCSKDKQEKYFSALALLNKVKYAAKCQDVESALDTMTLANKLCMNSNCNTCK